MKATRWRLAVLLLAMIVLSALEGIMFFRPPNSAGRDEPKLLAAATNHFVRGWTNGTQAVHPPAVAGSMMTYSPRDDLFVLFGGSDGEPIDQTWILDPKTLSWTESHPAVRPAARADAALVYDSSADAVLLFGGWYETPDETYHRLADTWSYFIGNATWIQRNPLTSPSPRSDAAVAYDETEGVTLLFGGFDGANYLGDMWYYVYANDTWTPRQSPLMPSPRADGRMVYDPQHRSFFLFSGNDYSDGNFNFRHLADMWRYSWLGNAWTEIFTDVIPMPRDYAVFATDLAFGELLLTGGYGNRTVLGDIWAFNTTELVWRNITVPGGPAPRMAAVGGYSPQEDALVVYGGGANNAGLADTWFFRYPPLLIGIVFVSSPDPVTGQSVAFSSDVHGGSGSFVQFSWSFGDGQIGHGKSTTHTFGAPGVYRVELVVQDNLGDQIVKTMNLAVGVLMPLWVDVSLLIIGLCALSISVFVFLRRYRKSRGYPRSD